MTLLNMSHLALSTLQGAIQAEGQPVLSAQCLVTVAVGCAHPLPADGGPHLQLHCLLLGW